MARIYTTDELNDHTFYLENRADILAAIGEGRIAPAAATAGPEPDVASGWGDAALERLRPILAANLDHIPEA